MTTLRSIVAIVAGMAFIVALSIGTDLGLEHTILPTMNTALASPALLALALAYRTLFGVGGAWITAKLAPARPMTHALILGAIGVAAALAGVIAQWGSGQHWYPIALVLLSLPQSWLGARLAAR